PSGGSAAAGMSSSSGRVPAAVRVNHTPLRYLVHTVCPSLVTKVTTSPTRRKIVRAAPVRTGRVGAMSDEEVRRVLGLMYQQDTLRMFAALVLDEGTEAAGLDREAARRALDRLERGGLVARDEDGAWRARPERF